MMIDNTDFSKEGAERRSNPKKGRKRRGQKEKNNESKEDEDVDPIPVLHPADIKVLDQVLDKMRGYDPLVEAHGDSRKDSTTVVDHEYFILSEEDEMESDESSENNG